MRIPTVASAIVYDLLTWIEARVVQLTPFQSSLVMSSTSALTLVKKALPSVSEYTGWTFDLPGGLLLNGYVSSSTFIELAAESGPTIYSCQNESLKLVAPK